MPLKPFFGLRRFLLDGAEQASVRVSASFVFRMDQALAALGPRQS
jgi:hypothetical protein